MDFVVKKTTELTETEKFGILSLFNSIFKKERTLEHFHNQFLYNPLGYSFHSMIVDEGQIVGCNSYIPAYYSVNNELVLLAVSTDTMVAKAYRDYFCFYDMIIAAYVYMKEVAIVFVYGFPNDNSYFLYTKSKLMKDIGSLDTYCLPYRIGGIKRQLKMFNWLSIVFVRSYVFFASLFSSGKQYRFPIEKEAASYNATRYKRLDGNYHVVDYRGSGFAYKIMEYEGVKSAFLIDVFEKSPRNFCRAVQYIIKNHRQEFDILLYVGFLPFGLHGMIRLPRKISPKNFHFVGKILRDDKMEPDFVFNLNHWDVNLSNYDLL
jgi:hypothetical protein